MKKNNRFFAVMMALVCAAMMMVSCSKAPEAALVPSNALYVVDLNVASLWQKGELDKSDNIGFVKMLRQELRNENAELAQLVDAIIENPSNSGLDLKHDLVGFASSDGQFALAALVKSQKKFGETLKQLCDQTGIKASFKDDKYHIFKDESNTLNIVWDKHKAYICVNMNGASRADVLMNLKKSESMAKNDQFMDFWGKRDDFNMWMDFGRLLDMMAPIMDKELPAIMDEFKESSYSFCLNFDKGQLVSNVYYFGKVTKMMKQMTNHKFNTDLLDYMPETALAALSMAVDIDTYIQYSEGASDEVKEVLDTELADGVTVRDLVKTLEGSAILGFTDLQFAKDGKDVLPGLHLVADIKDEALLDNLLSSELPKTKGYYVVENDLFPLYIAVANKVAVVTTDPAMAQRVLKGEKNSKGLKDIAKQIKRYNTYFYADLQIDHYPAELRDMMPSEAVTLLRQYLVGMESYADQVNHGLFKINLVNKKQNSLFFTLHFVDDNLMTFAKLFQSLQNGINESLYEEEDLMDESEDIIFEEAYEEE